MPRTIPSFPHPSSQMVDEQGRTSREWYDKLDEFNKAMINRVPVTGSVSFSGTTSATISFGTNEQNSSYDVWLAAIDSRTVWASSKTTAGFTAQVNSAMTGSVRWQLIRS